MFSGRWKRWREKGGGDSYSAKKVRWWRCMMEVRGWMGTEREGKRDIVFYYFQLSLKVVQDLSMDSLSWTFEATKMFSVQSLSKHLQPILTSPRTSFLPFGRPKAQKKLMFYYELCCLKL